jgi:hypothetical protein
MDIATNQFNLLYTSEVFNRIVLCILSISNHNAQNLSLHINTPQKYSVIFALIKQKIRRQWPICIFSIHKGGNIAQFYRLRGN